MKSKHLDQFPECVTRSHAAVVGAFPRGRLLQLPGARCQPAGERSCSKHPSYLLLSWTALDATVMSCRARAGVRQARGRGHNIKEALGLRLVRVQGTHLRVPPYSSCQVLLPPPPRTRS